MATLFQRRTIEIPAFETGPRAGTYPDCLSDHDRAFLDRALAAAPYLGRLAKSRSDLLGALATKSLDDVLDDQCAAAIMAGRDAPDEATLGQVLRRLKGDAHLTLALAELSGALDVMSAAAALSRFADGCVRGALHGLVRLGSAEGKFADCPGPDDPISGLFVLALGKLGAGELNFSSDIDLVVFYDPDRLQGAVADEPGKRLPRLIRSLSRLLNEVTPDGYVFRVDLRLRPDPSATPPALSIAAAMNYYESLGQNWERAAYIKARYCAGDAAAAADFLAAMRPFVWRRTLDYAAVEDIHSLARQIQAVGDRARIRAAGHDLKLGRGGIREIEFYAQIPQLVMGGRMRQLRIRSPFLALSELATAGVIDPDAARQLAADYVFLRQVEHRIQMLSDEQTQTLPEDGERRLAVARLAGFSDVAALDAEVSTVLQRVHGAFSRQFATETSLADECGSLVFTGVEPTRETLQTLESLGFQFPDAAWARMNSWLAGKARALRTTRARQVLTRIAPQLLRAMSETGEPDSAFTRFAAFIEGLPMGVQPLSMLENEPELARELVTIIGLAPQMATTLAQRPAVIDVMLEARFSRPLVDDPEDDVAERMRFQMSEAANPEDAMNGGRRLVREERFRVGSQLLVGRANAAAAGAAFARLADISICAMADVAMDQLHERFGPAPGHYAILGLGKLGSRELAADSDLDLMIIYDPAEGAAEDAPRFFTRFAQRFVSALSSPTEEGSMYEADMQLRPSGKAGPVAVRLSSFGDYYRDSAWTWERMALTRARIVAGEGDLGEKINAHIATALAQPATAEQIVADVLDMRRRLERDRPAKGGWDLKRRPGGILDIEFMAQASQLLLAQTGRFTAQLNTADQLETAQAAGLLSEEETALLQAAAALWLDLSQIIRTAHGVGFDPGSASRGFATRLSQLAGQSSLSALSRQIEETAGQVRELFETCLGRLQDGTTESPPRFVEWGARPYSGDEK